MDEIKVKIVDPVDYWPLDERPLLWPVEEISIEEMRKLYPVVKDA